MEDILQEWQEVLSWRTAFSMNVNTVVTNEGPHAYPNVEHWSVEYRRDQERIEFSGRRLLETPDGTLIPGTEYQTHQVIDWKESARLLAAGVEQSPSRGYLSRDRDKDFKKIESNPASGSCLDGYVFGSDDRPIAELLRTAPATSYRVVESPGEAGCYVAQARTRYGLVTVSVCPARSWSPVAYTVRKEAEDFFNDKPVRDLPKPKNYPKIKTWIATVVITDWVRINGLSIAAAGEFVLRLEHLDGSVDTTRYIVNRTNIEIADNRQTPQSVPELLSGLTIDDQDRPGIRYEWHEGGLAPMVDSDVVRAVDDAVRTALSTARPASVVQQPTRYAATDPYCGLYCAYGTIKFLGREVVFADLLRPKYLGSRLGSSLTELEQALRDRGLWAQSFKNLSSRVLRTTKNPIILYVRGSTSARTPNHFVLLLPTEGEAPGIIDAPRFPYLRRLSLSEVLPSWTGEGIVVSDHPVTRMALYGADLRTAIIYGLIAAAVALLVRQLASHISWPVFQTKRSRTAGFGIQAVGLLLFASALGWLHSTRSTTGLFAHPAAAAYVQRAFGQSLIARVPAAELDRLIQAHVVLIDARPVCDFEAKRLPGAINIPADVGDRERRAAMDHIPSDARLIVYCNVVGCPLDESLAIQLLSDGYPDVSVLEGDWQKWISSRQ